MYVQLRETADELARVLWREHTVYRERGGGVVIRGEHVRRWISLAPTGGKDRALLRAGRILDGGTTAPARSEIVVDLTSGTAELATICRRLLADVAAGADAAPGPSRAGRPKEKAGKPGKQAKPGRRPRGSRHTSPGSWFVLLCVAAVLGAWLYSLFGRAGY
ncbi:hypothetical protein AQF52_6486 [Streptomyces venezuelae]|uniref:hypothetical protein n=1 Tax=Streptomyces gardneri TaxID=66892 RepID=UPI0006E18B5C|nr:hypothetical protein [Streptomyces gardneri]ALO12079.1 hypothetical protein AQF52_6486 [Streptomyces venezuelae]QPK48915.1 hypothetical protein H4W23_32570 [Streptomyces gardneri]WRK40402.1 hypothetical protein U0M97_32730 [Streptomyces venezuelae]